MNLAYMYSPNVRVWPLNSTLRYLLSLLRLQCLNWKKLEDKPKIVDEKCFKTEVLNAIRVRPHIMFIVRDAHCRKLKGARWNIWNKKSNGFGRVQDDIYKFSHLFVKNKKEQYFNTSAAYKITGQEWQSIIMYQPFCPLCFRVLYLL